MAKHADKAVVLNLSALRAKYGPAGVATIRAALKRMVAADRARQISTRLVALDRASTMKGFHGPAVADPTDAPAVKAAVDAVAAGLTAHYVLLLGAPDVIPQQQLRNPTGDEDPTVPSDLPYACAAPVGDDPGDFVGPTRVVGRLPDLVGETDPAFLARLVDLAAGWTSRGASAHRPVFALSTDSWKISSRLSLQQLGGDPATVHLSPLDGPTFTVAVLRSRTHFVNCHGGDTDPRWSGERKGVAALPVALEPSSLAGRVTAGTVVAAECCYGAQHYAPSLAGGVPSLALTYSSRGRGGSRRRVDARLRPGRRHGVCRPPHPVLPRRGARRRVPRSRALLQARQRFAQEHGELDPVDLKTLVQFDLLGDPSITPVQVPVPKSAPTAMRATSVGAGLRRRALARVGLGLTESVVRAAPEPARRTNVARVGEVAARAGVTPGRDATLHTYRTSAAVPSRTAFHLLTEPDRRRITIVRDEPGQPPTARTVVRK